MDKQTTPKASPPAAVDADPGPEGYTPSEKEIEGIRAGVARNNTRPVSPKIKLRKNEGPWTIGFDHVSLSLARILTENAIGTCDQSFLDGILQQLFNATLIDGKPSEANMNFALSAIKGVQPKDEIEAMLATQMAAVHIATMKYAKSMACAQNTAERNLVESGLNKLARTFTAQVEALKRYRSKGEQVVRVERVYVAEGGQAVVGNVTHRGGVQRETGGQLHEPRDLPLSEGGPLPSAFEANKAAVPQPSAARSAGVSQSRRVRRRTEGKYEQPQTRA